MIKFIYEYIIIPIIYVIVYSVEWIKDYRLEIRKEKLKEYSGDKIYYCEFCMNIEDPEMMCYDCQKIWLENNK